MSLGREYRIHDSCFIDVNAQVLLSILLQLDKVYPMATVVLRVRLT